MPPLSLDLPVSSLKLPNRATNALTRDGVHTVAQLAQRTEADLLGTPNFGRMSLVQVKEALRRRKLRLGMVLPPRRRQNPRRNPLLVLRHKHKIHQNGPVGWFKHRETTLQPYHRVMMLNHLNASKH